MGAFVRARVWGGRLEAGMPGSPGSWRAGETGERIHFCRTPTAYQALSRTLAHRGDVGDTVSNNDPVLSARCMPRSWAKGFTCMISFNPYN